MSSCRPAVVVSINETPPPVADRVGVDGRHPKAPQNFVIWSTSIAV
jgi:hypothetical protein